MTTYLSLIREGYLNHPIHAILQAPTGALLGVTQEMEQLLKQSGIDTVFDLAYSSLFAAARSLTETSPERSVFREFGKAPGDLVDAGAVADVASAGNESPRALRAVDDDIAQKLEQTLNVASIREMACWPPYLAARYIADKALQPETLPGFDVEAPLDLLPRTGDYPTERFTYQSLVLDSMIPDETDEEAEQRQPHPAPRGLLRHKRQRPRAVPDTGDLSWTLIPPRLAARGMINPKRDWLVDLEKDPRLTLASLDMGLGGPSLALGAVLTWSQTWHPLGVALGQLLHSVALAPGETTRIAMIDWSRRTNSSTTDAIDQAEQLSSTMTHIRAINEVSDMVAKETQTGHSQSGSRSSSRESGSASGGLKIGLSGVSVGGTSGGTASSNAFAWGWSTSSGNRDITTQMSQNISDATQQAASASRSRRASIVREVSTSESEKVTTRAITNFNHMHALSVQYYEIVQAYRTVLRLQQAERCLFLPIEQLDFSDPVRVHRFRYQLANAALSPEVAQALMIGDSDSVLLRAPLLPSSVSQNREPWDQDSLHAASTQLRHQVGRSAGAALLPHDTLFAPTKRAHMEVNSHGKEVMIREVVAELRNGSQWIWNPAYAGGKELWPTENGELRPISLTDIRSLEAVVFTDEANADNRPKLVTIRLPFQSGNDALWLGVQAGPPDEKGVIKLRVEVTNLALVQDAVREHLRANADHYSGAVWSQLSPAQMGTLLSRYHFRGTPLVQLLDPTPVAVSGCYLVMRMPLDDDADKKSWDEWLNKHHIEVGKRTEDLVPLPSGGVFAEAVLGRFNSAEKIDLTRFWNWQDSPIPVVAPDVAPVQTGGRQAEKAPEPGNLDQPIIQQVQPTSLPDPNFAAALALIGQNNLFRDMSGMAQTAALTGQAMALTSAAAGRAAAQAGANMNTAADFLTEVAKLALSAGMAPGGAGGQGVTAPSAQPPSLPNTATNVGGVLEQARKADAAETAHAKERSPEGSTRAPVTKRQDKVLKVSEPPSGGLPPSRDTGVVGTKVPPSDEYLERTVLVHCHLPGTDVPISGLYYAGFRAAEVAARDGEWSGSSFSINERYKTGVVSVRQPSGLWQVLVQMSVNLPDSMLTIPIDVLPGMDEEPIKVAENISNRVINREVTGSISVDTDTKALALYIEGTVKHVQIPRTYTIVAGLQTTAEMGVATRAAVEAEVNTMFAGGKASGEIGYNAKVSMTGELQASRTISYTVEYTVLENFRIVTKKTA